MDPFGLLSSSENLYKYLLVGGIGLLMVSLFYPIDKRYELNKQTDEYNFNINKLNYQINELKSEVDEAAKSSSYIISELQKLNSKSKVDTKTKDSLKQLQYTLNDSLRIERKAISNKQLDIDYNRAKIATLHSYIDDFRVYERLFFWSGIIVSIAGVVGWFVLMKKTP